MKSSFFSVRKALALTFASFFSIAFFSSCFKNHNDAVNIPVAGLMVFNLAPGSATGGFSIGGNVLTNSPLSYGNYTGTYLSIYPGERAVTAFNYYSSSQVFASVNGSFVADKFYSLFLVGVDSSLKSILVQDNFDSLSAGSGKAFVRYINAIPDSVNALTVKIGSAGTPETAAFGSVSSFEEVQPGDLNIAISNSNGVNISRTIQVDAKKVYTVLLSGVAGSATTAVEIKYISNGTLSDNATNTTGIVSPSSGLN